MSNLFNLLSAMCGKIKKADLSQNDPEAADYVKGRTHWKETTAKVFFEAETFLANGKGEIETEDGVYISELVVGGSYTVSIGDATYSGILKKFDYVYYLGNLSFIDGDLENTEESFLCAGFAENNAQIVVWQINDTSLSEFVGMKRVKLEGDFIKYHALPSEYLPIMNVSEENCFGVTSAAIVKSIVRGESLMVTIDKTTYKEVEEHIKQSEFPQLYFLGIDEFKSFVVYDKTIITDQTVGKSTIDVVGWGINENAFCTMRITINGTDETSLVESVSMYKAPKATYLMSTTEGSTKKFKITVDDSGNLTATEV